MPTEQGGVAMVRTWPVTALIVLWVLGFAGWFLLQVGPAFQVEHTGRTDAVITALTGSLIPVLWTLGLTGLGMMRFGARALLVGLPLIVLAIAAIVLFQATPYIGGPP